jgi:hypothetical protein
MDLLSKLIFATIVVAVFWVISDPISRTKCPTGTTGRIAIGKRPKG